MTLQNAGSENLGYMSDIIIVIIMRMCQICHIFGSMHAHLAVWLSHKCMYASLLSYLIISRLTAVCTCAVATVSGCST